MIVRYTIPIKDYYGTEVFFKHIYLQCLELSPDLETLKQVVSKKANELDKFIEEFPESQISSNEWKECLETLDLVKENRIPRVYPTGQVGGNIFVDHPKFGKQSINVDIINVINLNDKYPLIGKVKIDGLVNEVSYKWLNDETIEFIHGDKVFVTHYKSLVVD